MQRQAVSDAMRPSAGRLDEPLCNLDGVSLGKLELEPIQIEEHSEFMIFRRLAKS
jgi:hypothetical protein